jgi:hypothetical protein
MPKLGGIQWYATFFDSNDLASRYILKNQPWFLGDIPGHLPTSSAEVDPVASDLHEGPLATFARRSQTVPWNGFGFRKWRLMDLSMGYIYIWIYPENGISDPENDIYIYTYIKSRMCLSV